MLSGCRRKKEVAQPPAMPDLKTQPSVRVLLLNDVTEFIFSCDESITVTDSDAQLRLSHFGTADGPVPVSFANSRISFGRWSCSAEQLNILPDSNAIVSVNGRRYRGQLKIVTARDGNSFDVVNVVGVEEYLAGVIGAEMPSYWEPQALEAQTIAARTYCLYIKKRFGANRHWDVRKTAANQVYNGVSEESQAVWRAIGETAGKVLVCKQADGAEDIFPSYYGSVCAGHTENSKNVFGDVFSAGHLTVEPLQGVTCKYCAKIAKRDFLKWPSVYVPKAKLYSKLAARYPSLKRLKNIEEISAISSSRYDGLTRITRIKLTDSNGASDTLRAEDFRLAVDPTGHKIKSAAFKIQNAAGRWAFVSGKGYGHGVGMCQCGAEGLARKGKTTEQILSFYYPGAKIKKLY